MLIFWSSFVRKVWSKDLRMCCPFKLKDYQPWQLVPLLRRTWSLKRLTICKDFLVGLQPQRLQTIAFTFLVTMLANSCLTLQIPIAQATLHLKKTLLPLEIIGLDGASTSTQMMRTISTRVNWYLLLKVKVTTLKVSTWLMAVKITSPSQWKSHYLAETLKCTHSQTPSITHIQNPKSYNTQSTRSIPLSSGHF